MLANPRPKYFSGYTYVKLRFVLTQFFLSNASNIWPLKSDLVNSSMMRRKHMLFKSYKKEKHVVLLKQILKANQSNSIVLSITADSDEFKFGIDFKSCLTSSSLSFSVENSD